MSFIIQEQASPVLFEIGKEEPTGAGGTIDFYLADQDFLYFEGNASANFAIDLAYDAATTLDDALNVDDLVTVTLAAKNGSTPYYLTNFQIDGGAGAITINWQNGEAPSSGKANEIDYYTFKVLKTSGNAYTVFASVVSTAYGIIPNRELTKASAATATETIYYARENIVFFQGTGTTDVQLDLTFATGQTLDSVMATGDVFDFGLKITNAGSAAELVNVTVDSIPLNNLYYVGNAPTGIPSAVVSYDLELVKVGSASFNLTYEETKETGPTFFAGIQGAEILVIAGGGGAGAAPGRTGGAGAGGLLYYGAETPKTPNGAAQNLRYGTYTVTVGAGGAATLTTTPFGNPGFDSSFVGTGLNITSTGGGYGAAGGAQGGPPVYAGGNGGSGGSGSGQGAVTGTGISGQGNNAGGTGSYAFYSGGGGGAGAAGITSGNGGAGLAYSITGSSVTRAGGGGTTDANGRSTAGGAGGGGNASFGGTGQSGTINTGSGGGGGAQGGGGGKGVIIIKYPDTFPAATTTGSPTVVVSGGFRRYTFNDSGTFTVV